MEGEKKMKVYHNSWETYYKSIKGAVHENEECKFTVLFQNESEEENQDDCMAKELEEIKSVEMHLYHAHKNKTKKIDMHCVISNQIPNQREYEVSSSFEDTGCIYYFFLVYTEHQIWCVEHMQNNEAHLVPWKEKMDPSKWHITVYQNNIEKSSVLQDVLISYQIFPDSFFASGTPKKNVPKNRRMYSSTNELPKLTANEDGSYQAREFYGGDIQGIIQKIPYLTTVCNCIYLNPPYESTCNHHYDSKSYVRVDPSLGTMEEFEELCSVAKQNGISIMLDMVFNHVGKDSELFRDAKENPNSPYQDFFYYENGRIASWWGDGDLYALNQDSEAVQQYIKKVCLFWKQKGVSIARIDVADELKNHTLCNIHSLFPTILEIWQDATIKDNIEGLRSYFFKGDQADGVMNYCFQKAIIEYVRNKNATYFYEEIQYITDHYAMYNLANSLVFVSTHDTPRIMTVLGGEPLPDFEPMYRQDVLKAEATKRKWMADHRFMTKEQQKLAVKLTKIAMLLQFCLPGIPQIYYGDEIGMEGYSDPDNRRYHLWENGNQELLDFTLALTKFYRENAYLKEGMTDFYACNPDYLILARKLNEEELILCVNVSDHTIQPQEIKGKEIPQIVLTTGCQQINWLAPYSGIIIKRKIKT